ncbi:hypothetical protein ABTY61_03680 [Kitasatospora sp. NPDC096128]
MPNWRPGRGRWGPAGVERPLVTFTDSADDALTVDPTDPDYAAT